MAQHAILRTALPLGERLQRDSYTLHSISNCMAGAYLSAWEAAMDEDPIWELERRFWLEGICVYEAHLHKDARMIFPGMGILDRSAILDSLRDAPRWDHVDMCNRQLADAGNVVFLAYVAVARRGDSHPYKAFCGSTYIRKNPGALMIAHQQTLMD
ncbi:nuclear transport factor 2 family protein [Shinella kummerowiae]|uniref:nuclear transport factor 2 family protein n=1 Tax=Shinella kummerowiae TaxID=417745 RepID=UPI0021B5F76F|nr:nuclear transport factor 2 family protein [Shinella kummerowiae]MCT7664117.1 nuclear transport factor 2 family protein [Shinella kummerowiae]